MHKSRLGTLIVDCKTEDLAREARFWANALGLKPEETGEQKNTKYIRLFGKDDEVQVLLQAVDHESRIHIDIETDNRQAEVNRLAGHGAQVIAETERWTIMQAPSGHRFCIIGPIRDGFDEHANVWD